MERRTIGVALSGGGHRASLFGLGVLLYLVDAGKNADVVGMSSVSGGSLTNGYVAWKKGFRGVNREQFDEQVKPLAQRIARGGTLWGWWGTWVYLLILVLTLLAAIGVLLLPCTVTVRGLSCAGLIVLAGILLQFRGHVCGWAIAARLFPEKPQLAVTADAEIDHVFCATDLHAGEHVYFSGNFVCAYRFGWGEPAELPLHVAVQSSAAFPGGFPARWLRTRRFQFQEGQQKNVKWMTLIDGGVYDNMAEQWLTGIRDRKNRGTWSDLAAKLHEPDEVIVVNASKNLPWTRRWCLGVPWLGEVLTLKTVTDVMYDNTTTHRRRGLVSQFDLAEREGKGQRGTLVMIEQPPYKVAKFFETEASAWPDRAQRAKAALEKLAACPEEAWKSLAQRNAKVATTLRALGIERSADLLYHGYVSAMCNAHVILGYPLLDLPCRERFRRLVS